MSYSNPIPADGFVCYDGWLPELDQHGDPVGGYRPDGGRACELLLDHIRRAQSALMDAALHGGAASSSSPGPGPGELPIRLVSFSHGTVALNQVFAEMGGKDLGRGTAARHVLERTESLVWLDPGLAQEPGAGILLGDRALLRAGARRLRERDAQGGAGLRGAPQVAVALTPYQLQRPASWLRGWRLAWGWPPIMRESAASAARRRFLRALRNEGFGATSVDDAAAVAPSRVLHSEDCLVDREPSLESHFAVLAAFTAPWDIV